MKQSLTHKISRANTELKSSTINPTILTALESIGYTLPKIQEGIGIVNAVILLNNTRIMKYGEQSGVALSCKAELKQIWQVHSPHRKLAQVAYQGDAMMHAQLGLGRLNYSLIHRLAYLEKFYEVLLEDSSRIVQFGLKKAELSQMQASVDALMDKRLKHATCKGQAQNTTQKRNEALRKMEAWMKDFRKAARFALRDEPQLLESLGILVPSPR